jgi:hypothetical protein
MTLTDLINKLQQLQLQEGNFNINVVDESEGAFNYFKVMFNNSNQNSTMSAGRPGEVIL